LPRLEITTSLGDELGHVDVVALQLQVGAQRAERREVLRDGDAHHARFLDVGERIGARGRAGDEGRGGQCVEEDAAGGVETGHGRERSFGECRPGAACARRRRGMSELRANYQKVSCSRLHIKRWRLFWLEPAAPLRGTVQQRGRPALQPSFFWLRGPGVCARSNYL
jgi:hypothetical protein